MPYQVDVWGGDLHQNHLGAKQYDDWAQVSDFIGPLVDAGLLCNVLHTDFQAPPERVAEMEKELSRYLS